ncbi:MAG: hypothetical protein K8S62_03135 [Candidatus Sabulitectum sp.]|nr:hypothetical protein [Candidatus Sabulitectum sp.]
MKKAAFYLILCFLLFSGCGENTEPTSDSTTVKVDETPEVQQYATVSVIPGDGVSGQIKNAYCSLSDDDDWGIFHDAYPVNEPITFQVVPGRHYDFKCLDSGNNRFFKWDVLIEEDGFEWHVQSSDSDNLFRYYSHPSDSHKGVALVHITTAPGCGVLSSIQTIHDDGFGEVCVEHLNGQFLQPNTEFTFRIRTHRSYLFLVENTYGDIFFICDIQIEEGDFHWEISSRNQRGVIWVPQ